MSAKNFSSNFDKKQQKDRRIFILFIIYGLHIGVAKSYVRHPKAPFGAAVATQATPFPTPMTGGLHVLEKFLEKSA